jgi:hypothetical protein
MPSAAAMELRFTIAQPETQITAHTRDDYFVFANNPAESII